MMRPRRELDRPRRSAARTTAWETIRERSSSLLLLRTSLAALATSFLLKVSADSFSLEKIAPLATSGNGPVGDGVVSRKHRYLAGACCAAGSHGRHRSGVQATCRLGR